MKRIILVLGVVLGLNGCATWPSGNVCPNELRIPNYFEGDAQLVAFELQASARGYRFDGILQLKKQTDGSYEASLFAIVGGVQLLRAHITQENVSYPFIMKTINRAAVRNSMKRLLLSLVAAPQTQARCKQRTQGWQVRYADAPHLVYEYPIQQIYPRQVRYRKMLGSSYLSFEFESVSPAEENVLFPRLEYQDGALQAQLWLLQVK